jgi:hypothetical protein
VSVDFDAAKALPRLCVVAVSPSFDLDIDRPVRAISDCVIASGERVGEFKTKQLEGFGSYGFPESHAASFALIATPPAG